VFIELHSSSAFSFLEAASLPEALVERAAALGYPALALVDRDGVYGAPRFYKAAKAAGIKAIVGCEITMTAVASSQYSVASRKTEGERREAGGERRAGSTNAARTSARRLIRASHATPVADTRR
jgi:error-prone DNA polymerase